MFENFKALLRGTLEQSQGLAAGWRLRVRSGHQQKQAYVGNGQPQVVTLECAAHFDFPLRSLTQCGRDGHRLVYSTRFFRSPQNRFRGCARGACGARYLRVSFVIHPLFFRHRRKFF
jgi:hypothetical protein